MTQLHSIVSYLNALLPDHPGDIARNGLQVESSNENIERVVFAVDAGLSTIEGAIRKEADLMIVHHGLFWGQSAPITGVFAKKVEALLKGGCSLYASHLPLDASAEVGNNYEIARALGLENLGHAIELAGEPIGCSGEFTHPKSREEIIEWCESVSGATPTLSFPFGSDKIRRVIVVSGSGSSALEEAKKSGADLLLSGEPKHEAYHLCRELQMNAIFFGHYGSETFGVKALQARLEKDFGVSTDFVDEPTGV